MRTTRIPLTTTSTILFEMSARARKTGLPLFLFTKAILSGQPIDLFNHGEMQRDFTYIDDIVEGIVRVLDRPAKPNPDWTGDKPDTATRNAPYRLYNIGNNSPVKLGRLVEVLETALGIKATKILTDMQPGDVPSTYADVTALVRDVGFQPSTSIEDGVERFVAWYREFYKD